MKTLKDKEEMKWFPTIGVREENPTVIFITSYNKEIKKSKFDWDNFFMWGGIISLILSVLFLGTIFLGKEFLVWVILGLFIGLLSNK